MIVESIVLSISSIVISSLYFANLTLKRLDQQDKEDEIENQEIEILPYELYVLGSKCPKCGLISQQAPNHSVKGQGPNLPKTCKNRECPAIKQSHLHGSCESCDGHWFMRPLDYKG
jgi:hypothetical protein